MLEQYIHNTGYIETLELELHYLRLFGTLVTFIWAGELSTCGEGGGTRSDHSDRGDIRACHLLIFHSFYTNQLFTAA